MSVMHALRLLIGLLAAGMFYVAGADMHSIVSQAGNTVNEAFYQAMGSFSYAMAILSIALAIPTSLAASVTRSPAKEQSSGPSAPPPTP